jgi:hypothetical protein
VAPQLEHGDELLVMRLDCVYGNEARDLMMAKATGTHLLFMDDDDVYEEGALAVVRSAVMQAPERFHVFRMRHGEGLTWNEPQFGVGNVGTPMVCFRNGRAARWADDDGATSDFEFFRQTLVMVGGEPIFHEDVIAVVRP